MFKHRACGFSGFFLFRGCDPTFVRRERRRLIDRFCRTSRSRTCIVRPSSGHCRADSQLHWSCFLTIVFFISIGKHIIYISSIWNNKFFFSYPCSSHPSNIFVFNFLHVSFFVQSTPGSALCHILFYTVLISWSPSSGSFRRDTFSFVSTPTESRLLATSSETSWPRRGSLDCQLFLQTPAPGLPSALHSP